VIDRSRPVAEVARENGLVAQTLGNWVTAYREKHASDEPEMSLAERARLKELERENRELRMENEFLGKGVPRTLAPGSCRSVRVRAVLCNR